MVLVSPTTSNRARRHDGVPSHCVAARFCRCSSLLLLSLSLQTRLQPYRLSLLNTAEEVSLFATLFVLLAGVVFMAAPDGPTHVALAWAVVIAIACAVVTCIYVAFK